MMMQAELDDEKVRYISIVRKEGGEPIIGIPYREMSVDPDLVASFVLAIIIFENRQLKTFTKEGYVVIIEEGEQVVSLLIIDRVEDDSAYRTTLAKMTERFESEYESLLDAWKGDIRPFREFALGILESFPYRILDESLVPKLVSKSDAAPDHRSEIPWSVGKTHEKIHKILNFINGKRSIEEIVSTSGMPKSEVMAIFSLLDRYNWVTLSPKITPSVCLQKVTKPPDFLIAVYGEQISNLVELCDGTRTLGEVSDMLPYSIEVVTVVSKTLIDYGVLRYTPEEEQ
ncbi:MAG: hypothetical protein GF411_16395 [Candidatus Lokiarchaeota archaeon]|nr:hypothetical protein [Candidatus Lokiarchaeota archaeon]